MANETQFTTPVGRMIGGSLYRGETVDRKTGAPKVYKTGAKKGQPRTDYNIGVAFPKTPGVQHWASEPWLQQVWNAGHAAFPQGDAQRRDFAWKITDGDSQEPNKNMKRPCDQEGYPGHWVIWFSGTMAPKATNSDGSQYLHEQDAIKPGYYVQVFCGVTDNKPSETPGMYWNPYYVALAGFGPEIVGGPDVAQAKFGQGVQLPPGASATPVGGIPSVPAAPVPGPAVGYAPAAGAMAPPPPMAYAPAAGAVPPVPSAPLAGSAPAAPAGAPIAPVPVHPNPAFTQMVPPPAPAPAPVPARRQPTAKAEGRSYEQMLAMPGWTEELLVQNGYLA